jgi:hypothetical protein
LGARPGLLLCAIAAVRCFHRSRLRACTVFFTHHFQSDPQALVFERFFVFGSAFDIVAKYLISLNFSLLLR